MTGSLAVIVQSGSILMIRRGIEPFYGYWCPPGGVQEEGESLEKTAIRETKEETGLEVDVVEELGRVVGPTDGALSSHIPVQDLRRKPGTKLTRGDGGEVGSIRRARQPHNPAFHKGVPR